MRVRSTPFILVALLLAPVVYAASPPSAPQSPSATQAAATGEIDLSWAAPVNPGTSPVAGYRIYRSLTPSGLAHYLDLGNTLSFTDTGITDGAPRYYRFSAVNADGEGPLSSVVTASAKAPPTKPRQVTAVPFGRGNVSVNWTAPEYDGSSAIISYNVYRSATDGGPFNFLAVEPTTQYIDAGHPDNTTWFYRVSASNAFGEGPLSDIINGSTPHRPGPPVNLTASSFPLMGVRLDWERPYDEGGAPLLVFYVYRAIGTGAERVIATQPPQHEFFVDFDCPLLSECHYRIRTRNVVGFSDFSNNATALGDQLPIIG